MKLKISNQEEKKINNRLIGLFFEDINYGLDGGLHAEMLENRSFEFLEASGEDKIYRTQFKGDYGWHTYPNYTTNLRMSIESEHPLNEVNPHYLVYTSHENNQSFTNKAYDGICMKPDIPYQVSFYAYAENYKGDILISIIKDNIPVVSERIVVIQSQGWHRYEINLVSQEMISYGEFVVTLEDSGIVCFDAFSMMPSDAVYGLFRRDLVEMLKELRPGFLRFPGGCIVEGANMDNAYKWKSGIGSWEQRKPNWNRWAVHDNLDLAGEKTRYSYYNQSMGIGFYEYFLLCEYLGAVPIPIMNVGIACQYQSMEKIDIEDKAFEEYILDVLDLIEFANGDMTTKWGSIRKEMGHPEKFGLEYIGIGNEQWETEEIDFFERYRRFEKSIHAVYPQIKLIGSAGPDVISEKYTLAWEFYKAEVEKNPHFVYAIDEHYYMPPSWFKENTHFYHNYSRDIKVFVGEYAVHYGTGMNRPELNCWGAALSEAVFMTGLEKNGDIIHFASYAPLLARKGYAQWSPNLIWFDGESCYGTPSYYIQQQFSLLKGEHTLKTVVEEDEIDYSVSKSEDRQTIYIKLVNTHKHDKKITINFEFDIAPIGWCIMIHGAETESNSLESPKKLIPQKKEIQCINGMTYELQPESVHILIIEKIER